VIFRAPCSLSKVEFSFSQNRFAIWVKVYPLLNFKRGIEPLLLTINGSRGLAREASAKERSGLFCGKVIAELT
jgi:hypothetical protein